MRTYEIQNFEDFYLICQFKMIKAIKDFNKIKFFHFFFNKELRKSIKKNNFPILSIF